MVYRWADGWTGWNALAPYNGILVTAAASEVPQALLEQLAPGGRMVIPVGGEQDEQRLYLIENTGQGFIRNELDPVRFVPLLSGALQ